MRDRTPRASLSATALVATLLAGLLLDLGGCGYSIRPPFDRDYRTVYVPIFRSLTFRRQVNLMITEKVQKEIERRTPYKVVNNPEEADAVLEGVVNYVDKNVSVEAPTNLPRHLNALLTAEVKFYDNRPGAPGPPEQGTIISETAPFYPELGETAMLGLQKSIDKLVAQVVGMMEKAWPGQ